MFNAFLFERHEALGRGGGGQGGLVHQSSFFFKTDIFKSEIWMNCPQLMLGRVENYLKKIITHFTRASVPYLFICYFLACQYSQ